MRSKEWYKSKTVWSGILLILLGLSQIFGAGKIDPATLQEIFMGAGLIGLRQAVD